MRIDQKPYCMACEKNKADILRVLQKIIVPENFRCLEIAAGTGQHAVHFAPHFPNLQWVTSELPEKCEGLQLWLRESKVKNLHGPLIFDVRKDIWPSQKFDVVYVSNLFHVLPWKEVKSLFKTLGNRLREGAKVVFYGPFKYGGEFTSPVNEEFDKMLKAEDELLGLRNFEDVLRSMKKAGFELCKDYEMPRNNRLLHFSRLEHKKKSE